MRLRQYLSHPCSLCGGTLILLGQLGRLAWYRCRACGMEFSRELKREKARATLLHRLLTQQRKDIT